MPKIKTKHTHVKTPLGVYSVEDNVCVNSKGQFYTRHNKEYGDIAKGFFSEVKEQRGYVYVFSDSLSRHEDNLYAMHESKFKPISTRKLIIMYNIESHVAFAEDSNGQIFPNATYPNSKWNMSKDFGNHYSTNGAEGGYSLTIGAKVLTEVTYKYGKKEVVKYEFYNGKEKEANKLNEWCSFDLNIKTSKIMPYDPQTAIFFYNLLFGMANISKQIQELTRTPEKIKLLVSSGQKLLG